MAIPDVQDYLKNEIQKNIQGLLANSYIIREVLLRDYNDTSVQSFVNTFCTDDNHQGVEIPILFTYPFDKQDQTYILIQFEGGKELDGEAGDSLGLVVGKHDEAEGDVLTEMTSATVETINGFPSVYLEVKNPIESLHSIQYYEGNYELKDNRIYINYQDGIDYSNFKSKVVYTPQRVNPDGTKIAHNPMTSVGIDTQENYTVDIVSNNQENMRMLDSLVKVVFIYMRNNADEQTAFRLGKLQFAGNDILTEVSGDDTTATYGQKIFYRRTEVSYLLTYSIDMNIGRILNNVNLDE